MSSFIVVSGATGKTGSAVVTSLLSLNLQVRALVRDLDKAAKVLPTQNPLLSLHQISDVTNLDTLKEAYVGASGAFIVSPSTVNVPRFISVQAQAALETKVPHVVALTSSFAQYKVDTIAGDINRIGHQILKAFDLPYTVVGPDHFFQNYLNMSYQIKATDTVVNHFNVKSRAIDVADIGAVIAKIFQDGPVKHYQKNYLIIGDEDQALTTAEQVALLSKKIKRSDEEPIRVVELTQEELEESMRPYMHPFDLKTITKSLEQIKNYYFDGESDVYKILGRKPTSFEEWLDANIEVFKN